MITYGDFYRSFRLPKTIKESDLLIDKKIINAGNALWSIEKKGKLYSLDLARFFQKPPKESLSFLLKKESDQVKKKDIIAYKKSFIPFFSESLIAPADGVIESILDVSGMVFLREASSYSSFYSPLSGAVSVANGQCTITTSGISIQGAYGDGSMQFGLFSWVEDRDNQSNTQNKNIILGVRSGDFNIIKFIDAYPGRVAGVIAAGLPLSVTHELKKKNISFVLTEGVGQIQMSQTLTKVLDCCCGIEMSLFPETKVYAGAVRPVIFAAIKSQPTIENSSSISRITRAPYLGIYGKLVKNTIF